MPPSPPNTTAQDETLLRRTLELALANVEQADGGPFGALIAKNGAIIAESWNRVVADNDPTAHAEILAIRAACRQLQHFHLEGCTLYASSEPCPMCLAAAYWARVDRIVYANSRDEAAAIGFCDDELYCQLQLPKEARQVPMLHLPLSDATLPLQAWALSRLRIDY